MAMLLKMVNHSATGNSIYEAEDFGGLNAPSVTRCKWSGIITQALIEKPVDFRASSRALQITTFRVSVRKTGGRSFPIAVR
ncbi:MAG TPA: hypothetical protein VK208_16495 [Pyrinomonadaceae bacterium]|nr:hypothetical protein [Pyrinomonadaceae bacterium]